MPRITRREAERVAELSQAIETISPGRPAALATLVRELPRLLDCPSGLAYALRRDEQGGLSLDLLHHQGLDPRCFREMLAVAQRNPAGAFLYNPFLAERRQRDVALTLADLPDPNAAEIRRSVHPKYGLTQQDQVRALICEGPTILAWVGGIRPAAFTAREKRLLNALVPPLKRRLKLDRLLKHAELNEAALAAALEAVPAAAFVVAGPGVAVVHANAAGRAQLDQDRPAVTAALLAGQRGRYSDYRLTRLSVAGMPEHHLAVQRSAPSDSAPRVAAKAKRWGLTARQAETLALLAHGHSNRALAAMLGCTEGTVEVHVSALFEKSGAESRAQLVARFWTE